MKLETVDVGDTSNSMGDMAIMDADLYYKKIITNGVKDHETFDEAKKYFDDKKKLK